MPLSGWHFDNSYARLDDRLFARVAPQPVRSPRTVIFNDALAATLGLGQDDDVADTLSGRLLPPAATPIAQAYAGHQFGHFTRLGDGRAHLLGEHVTPTGQRFDIQLKGSGPTPYARNGDGRAALGPMLREYIISEAMAALGIPTTRSLAVIATGETVMRDTALPGAVLTRVAASHIRIGTFQYAAALGDVSLLSALVDYTLARHMPALRDAEKPALALLRETGERQARLTAEWMRVGFIHGVMNTDNVAISGDTIDYGPCAFMDVYHPATVFSSIDHEGRYAFANQPAIARWNLARLAEALLPLIDADESKALARSEEEIDHFQDRFDGLWLDTLRRKIGLETALPEDAHLVQSLLSLMEKQRADYTLTFRELSENENPSTSFWTSPDAQHWRRRWQGRQQQEKTPPQDRHRRMRAVNPAIIPRNHKVEEALAAATAQDNLLLLQRLLAALHAPYDTKNTDKTYREGPAETTLPYRTFCGT